MNGPFSSGSRDGENPLADCGIEFDGDPVEAIAEILDAFGTRRSSNSAAASGAAGPGAQASDETCGVSGGVVLLGLSGLSVTVFLAVWNTPINWRSPTVKDKGLNDRSSACRGTSARSLS